MAGHRARYERHQRALLDALSSDEQRMLADLLGRIGT